MLRDSNVPSIECQDNAHVVMVCAVEQVVLASFIRVQNLNSFLKIARITSS